MHQELKRRFAQAVDLIDKGNLGEARCILLSLSEESDPPVHVFSTLGYVCWELKHYDEAIEAFKRAINIDPKLQSVSEGLFNCLLRSGRYDEAFIEMKRFQTTSYSDHYSKIAKALTELSLENPL